MPITSLIIFFVSLALRVWEIANPINVDEALWMYRGSTFMQKVLEGDWAGTYLRHHPGVTNMWLIGTGHLLSSWIYSVFPDWLGVREIPLSHSCFSDFSCPIALWILPRLLQALVTSACMVIIYLLTKKLFGKAIAIIAISLLILEPFFLAYQRFITTDALQTDFSIISLLLLMLYLKGKSRWYYLIASGIFLGLATASKIPALFISVAVVIWLILIELGIWQASFPRRGWQRQAINLTLWGLTAVIIIVLIWPTLWVNPGETLQRIYADLQEEAARGDLFFMGENTAPGLSFYPLTLAYRLSPILQLGVICCLVTLVVPKLKPKNSAELIALAIVALVTLAVFSTSDSKIDRYIVMIVPELAILAAAGYLQVLHWVTWIKRRRNNAESMTAQKVNYSVGDLNPDRTIHPTLQPIQNINLKDNPQPVPTKTGSHFKKKQLGKNTLKVLLLLSLIQSIILIPLCPEYVSFYNPLFGGAVVGQNLFHVGIGEGLDKAAQWLNQQPNSQSLAVASWYRLGFAPYFHGTAIEGWSTDKVNLLKANYVVIYVNQIQRMLPEKNFVEYFLAQKPLHNISLAGLDYVKIYPGLAPVSQELDEIAYPTSILFGDKVRLIGYNLDRSQLKPGNKLSITFYWEFLQSPPSDWQLNLGWQSLDNKHISVTKVDLLNSYIPKSEIPPGIIFKDVQQLTVSKDLSPAHYNLTVGWIASEQKLAINATDKTGQLWENLVAIGEVEVK
jgi:hypothetical protein